MEETVYKKYGNRRLYDTQKSRYVTLEDIAGAVRDGRRVRVVDAKTKEDVTAFILTQIILEESRNRNFLLPVPLLHLIIQFGGNVLNDFFQTYLEQVLKNYLNYRSAADGQFKHWLDMGSGLPNLSAFKAFLELFPKMGPPSQKTGKD